MPRGATVPVRGMLDLRPAGGVQHGLLEWAGDDIGPLVLLLHANSLCAGAWSPVVRRLPDFAHVVACDQRAHGDSDAPPREGEAYSWHTIGADFTRMVEAVSAKYGRSPDLCVTHSFAGDCALMALAEAPAEVGRLLLLDPVLADEEGASSGAQRLAKGTRRQGEREAEGFDSADAVGAGLEKLLRAALAKDALHPEAKEAFAEFGAFPDEDARWRLKCQRGNEAEVYANRIALADHLESAGRCGKSVGAEVHLAFASKRRGRPEDQEAFYKRDLREAERVVACCGPGSAVHLVEDVGHFLVLEDPEAVAETIRKFL